MERCMLELKDRMKKAAVQATLMLLLGIILAFIVNALRSDGLSFFQAGPEQKVSRVGSNIVKAFSASESWSLYEQGRAVFLDARDVYAYQSAHLPGALHMPPEAVSGKIRELRGLTKNNKVIIAYCEGQGCTKAVELATSLQANGIQGVAVLPDGWQGWMDSGYPIEEGK
jgi:rhodanese-related sulfurtransferase